MRIALSTSLIATLLLFLSFASQVDSGKKGKKNRLNKAFFRWERPCLGSNVISPTTRKLLMPHMSVAKSSLKPNFRAISFSANKLAGRVNHLKSRYAKARFDDSDVVQDLETQVFQLFGRVRLKKKSRKSRLSLKTLTKQVKFATEDLARLAAYWEKTEYGERHFEPAKSYKGELKSLAINPEYGIYNILCALHIVIDTLGERPYSKTASNDIKGISNEDINYSRAARYWRDYLVLRDMIKLLIKIKRLSRLWARNINKLV